MQHELCTTLSENVRFNCILTGNLDWSLHLRTYCYFFARSKNLQQQQEQRFICRVNVKSQDTAEAAAAAAVLLLYPITTASFNYSSYIGARAQQQYTASVSSKISMLSVVLQANSIPSKSDSSTSTCIVYLLHQVPGILHWCLLLRRRCKSIECRVHARSSCLRRSASRVYVSFMCTYRRSLK